MTDAIPAATVILFRERAGAAPELLMVERARAMAFAGGAMVFPGGRIDPGDVAFAKQIGAGEDGPARIAAIRETIEEVGLPLGLSPVPNKATLTRLRAALHDGMPIADALAAARCSLDLTVLHPFARWRPDFHKVRVFDTRFFLARAPEGIEASVDATENTRLTWTTAADALAASAAGTLSLIFPTRRNLERVAQFASLTEAVADAEAHPQPVITPAIVERDGVRILTIPDRLGYPVLSEPVETALRG
ncbi:8-oxo-dGTP pyrophosphatase MutT (NUDIX family) [Sphingomonas jinjuensis]|uniref:8-oxo-dGTP pyrophosphatase MutT (NUDIX family) n=1 Tax=Sphingomonas jinjuensis TaxID=535907 RepID=A0A840FQ35_9SPHN|nr:NUDIX domain-containing protein [Sphingomonas jinjuensis]MBB4155385.1 8-oxo-dGTP pyrophosphatase MutT (NUDIX family) [Sphingomonas jinjuensis]